MEFCIVSPEFCGISHMVVGAAGDTVMHIILVVRPFIFGGTGHDSAHQWGWWMRQAKYHLTRKLGPAN